MNKMLYQGRISHSLGALSVGVLSITLFALLCCPMTAGGAVLATSDGGEISYSDLSDYKNSIAVAIQDEAELAGEYDASGHLFATSTLPITIQAENLDSYTLSISTSDGTQTLKSATTSTVINPVTGTMTSANYATNNLNTWGYRLTTGNNPSSTGSYSAVPATAQVVATNTTPTNLDYYTLGLALAADVSLPAGDYTNGIVISVVAQPTDPYGPFPSTLQYMQDMTPEICARVRVGETTELWDSRDNQTYPVAKMIDGNCWMIEDLRLRRSQTLTPDNTNIESRAVTFYTPFNNISDWSSTNQYTVALTYGGGSWVLYPGRLAVANSSESNNIYLEDICPKGWKLPLTGTEYNTTNGSFYNMLHGYGVVLNETSGSTHFYSIPGTYDVYLKDGTKVTTVVKDNEFNLDNIFPIWGSVHMVYYNRETSKHTLVWNRGGFWSSVKNGASTFKAFIINDDGEVYINDSARYDEGLSIRCLAK